MRRTGREAKVSGVRCGTAVVGGSACLGGERDASVARLVSKVIGVVGRPSLDGARSGGHAPNGRRDCPKARNESRGLSRIREVGGMWCEKGYRPHALFVPHFAWVSPLFDEPRGLSRIWGVSGGGTKTWDRPRAPFVPHLACVSPSFRCSAADLRRRLPRGPRRGRCPRRRRGRRP